ncbi:tetratricopeptide repeat protein [bacterium]|nr:tetratricopeptide repeat protein [bacterium]
MPQTIQRISKLTYASDQRIIPWKIAFKGFKERPILGWGWENYNIIFNKHFIPKIYDKWGPQSSWFDRSHNQILDILALSGILGLFSYLAFYGSIFWFLFKKIKISNRKEKVGLFILFLAFVAYFLQNLTVFDTPAPLIVFYFALGLVYFTITENANAERGSTRIFTRINADIYADQGANKHGALTRINTNSSEKINQFPLPILIFLIIIFVPWAIYKFNLEPYKQSKLGIIAISVSQNDLKSGIEWYKKALAKNCFTNPELRMQLVKSVIENSREQKISRENLREITEFAISEMEKSVKKHPLDVRYYLYLGQLYNFASQFDRIYAEKAEELLTRGLKLSPKRQQIYYEIGRAQILQRKYIKAIETYKKVLEIDKKTKESYWNLGLAYLINKEYKKGLNNINQARKMGRSYQKNESVTLFIADAYAELKNYKQAIALCNLVLRWNPKNINALVRKVIYYSRSGDKKSVQKSLEELKKINPSVAQEVKKMIKQKNE